MSVSRRVRFWLVAAIVIGVAFRLFHADWKLYSFDETITSLRSGGFTLADFEAAARNATGPVAIGTFERFQQPGAFATPANVVHSLATEDPQHPPLYFLTTLFAARAIPLDSVFWRRFPAIAFGIAAIFAAYRLGRELFADDLAALLLAALVALSPFHATYAQQAREYSLLALATFAASALLLRALRTGGASVVWYAIAIGAGLWTHPFFGFAALAHGAYVALPLSGATVRRRVEALVAIAAGALSFAPWIAVLLHGASTAAADTGWSRSGLTPLLYAGKWFFNAGAVFFDLDYVSVLLAPIAAALVILAFACAWILLRRAPRRVWSFVALLGIVPAAIMLGYDLRFHYTYAIQARYLTPLWIAFELATAFGLAQLVRARGKGAIVGRVAVASILLAGAASLGVSAYASSWWLANRDREFPAMAVVLRQTPGATIVALDDDTFLLELLPLVPATLPVFLHEGFGPQAIASARVPYAILKPSDIQPDVGADVVDVPLPPVFPPAHDPIIARLRKSAAASRRGTGIDDLALFTRRASALR